MNETHNDRLGDDEDHENNDGNQQHNDHGNDNDNDDNEKSCLYMEKVIRSAACISPITSNQMHGKEYV